MPDKTAIICDGDLDVFVVENEHGFRLLSYRKRKASRPLSDTLDFIPASAAFQERYFATIAELVEALKLEIASI